MQSFLETDSKDERLTAVILENDLLIKELHNLQIQLEAFYNTSSSIDSKVVEIKPKADDKVYYGAAEKVKADLPYRLGSKIISTPLKTKAVVRLPLDLFSEYKKFNKENVKKLEQSIDFSQYKDAQEAEKIKNHLSYRVGKTLVTGLSSPTSFIKMPIKLAKEFIDFKKKR